MADLQIKVTCTLPSPPQGGGGGGEGTATRRVRLSTEQCQRFFINATPKLMTKLQATSDWLIQHSNRIFKLSGLSSQIEMLD